MTEHPSSQSDINWSTSERPMLSAIAAGMAGIAGYIGGLQIFIHDLQPHPVPWIPIAALPRTVWWVIRRYGAILPGTWGFLPVTAAGVAALGAFTLTWVVTTRDNAHHVRGVRLHRNPKAAARALMPARGEGMGIALHPKIRIGEHQECRHILIVGGAGSGKTTILWPLIRGIAERGDRCLIFDFKGDFTASLTGQLTLLAPADARSARWVVGRDIETRLEAEALAETLVPLPAGGEGPIWARGARGLLIGLISHLQTTKPHAWDFADLAQIASETLSNYKKLMEVVEREHPPAKVYLMGKDSKTTMGFLAELAGALSHVINLGIASASANSKSGAWSVRGWLKDGSKFPRTVVLGYRPASKELSQAWLASVIEQVVRQVASMSDCKPDARRLWLVLDEVAQCGRIPSISDALVTLRSKGVRVVLGLQSIAQIEQVYDRHTATIWASSTATKMLCALQSPQDQRWASDLLGEREVERFVGQTQTSGGAGSASRSIAWQKVREPVMMPAQFGHDLGVNKKGARAVLLGGGTAAMLDWHFPEVQRIREDRVDARWVKVGYARPKWGAVPPPVAVPPPDDDESIPAPPPSITNKKPRAQVLRSGHVHRAIPESNAPGGIPPGTPRADRVRTAADAAKAREKEQESPDPVGELAWSAMLDAVVPGAGAIPDLARMILDAAGLGDDAPAPAAVPEFPVGASSENRDESAIEPDNELE